MGDIIPFKGFRFRNPEDFKDFSSKEEQQHLIPLEVWRKFIQEKSIIQEEEPAIYSYFQFYDKLPVLGEKKQNGKALVKGFICLQKIEEYEEGKIFRHENTIPAIVQSHLETLEQLEANLIPVHGLYTEVENTIEKLLDESQNAPLFSFTDDLKIKHVIAKIGGSNQIHKILKNIQKKSIVIADGHHRYESARLHKNNSKKELKQQQKPIPTYSATDFQLTYLTNTVNNDINILPIHRMISSSNFNKEEFLKKLNLNFSIENLGASYDLSSHQWENNFEFLLILKDEIKKLTLKTNPQENTWDFPEKIKALPLTALHYFVLEQALEIPGHKQTKSKILSFSHDHFRCKEQVEKGLVNCAILTQKVKVETILEVSKSGHMLPQKSTYFYPKMNEGFLFNSLKNEHQ